MSPLHFFPLSYLVLRRHDYFSLIFSYKLNLSATAWTVLDFAQQISPDRYSIATAIGFDMKYQKLLKNVYGYETEKEFREYVEKFVLKHEKDPRADVGTIVLGNIKEN